MLPDAKYVLVEPLAEYQAQSGTVIGELTNAELIAAAAGNHNGRAVINVHPDLVGSSLYREDCRVT